MNINEEYERIFGNSKPEDVREYISDLIKRLNKTPDASAGFINCDILGVARIDRITCKGLLVEAHRNSVFKDVKEILNNASGGSGACSH